MAVHASMPYAWPWSRASRDAGVASAAPVCSVVALGRWWPLLAVAHPNQVVELLVRLRAAQPVDELEHRLLRRHLHENSTQRLERGELVRWDQLLLLARAAL